LFRSAPQLLTARLRLRPHARTDFHSCKALWQHPHTTRFIAGTPQNDQEVWFRLLRNGGMWPMLGFGPWVFEDRATGAFLGEGGLLYAMRGIQGLDDIPEVGWALTPEACGKGLATEALGAVMDWADENVSAERTGCIIDPANTPSLRLAARLDFAEVARPQFLDKPIVLLHRNSKNNRGVTK